MRRGRGKSAHGAIDVDDDGLPCVESRVGRGILDDDALGGDGSDESSEREDGLEHGEEEEDAAPREEKQKRSHRR